MYDKSINICQQHHFEWACIQSFTFLILHARLADSGLTGGL